MLKKLTVENFALMDSLTLTFREGFTVLTGETGAGKSILIDAISYVLGSKFSREFIRTGTDRLTVTAEFTLEENPEEIGRFLKEEGIPTEKELVIDRSNDTGGRLTARINGRPVPVQTIKNIAPFLLDIHGQHNSQRLLDSESHIEYLDSFGNIEESEEFRNYSESYRKLMEVKSRLNDLTRNNERDRLIDYLKFQIDEIRKAGLRVEEEEELISKEKMLSHSMKIAEAVKTALEAMGDEFMSSLAHGRKGLESVVDVFPKVSESVKMMEEAYYNLEEAEQTLKSLTDDIYFSQSELDEVNERIYIYETMKKKYGATTELILKNLEESEERLYELENAGEIIEGLKAQKKELEEEILLKGRILSRKRIETGKRLSEGINSSLKEVGLKKAVFESSVMMDGIITEKGTDSVNFLISTNTGEPLKPLEKIVSGGELSRIMLAMKSTFIHKDSTPTVIFDEIDTGISGRIAESVGEKMYSISKDTQVLCVTHLPQIASFADTSLIVEKVEEKGRTRSSVREGLREDKVLEIAKMLAGSRMTQAIMDNAEEMVTSAEKVRKKVR